MNKICAVVVTYKRQPLLKKLLDSLQKSTVPLWGLVIVDNENSESTHKIVSDFENKASIAGSISYVEYYPQKKNLGGAGGFSRGIAHAVDLGADWVWVMDDDVEIVQDAVQRVAPYMDAYGAIVGNRLDVDDTKILQPYWINQYFGIANPLKRNPFRHGRTEIKTNILCFEGSFISRRVIKKIGTSDSRFFIYWDDVCYGYRASGVAELVRVNVSVVRRTRNTGNLHVGNIAVDKISDLKRYYMIRNRGYLAQHMKFMNQYHSTPYTFGSIYVYVREIVRMLLSRDFSINSIRELDKGWNDMRKIIASDDFSELRRATKL